MKKRATSSKDLSSQPKDVMAKSVPVRSSKTVQFEESQSAALEPATQSVSNSKQSLKDIFHLQAEGSPTKKTFKCKSKGCSKKAKFAHKDEDDDNPVLCEVHAAAIEGAYKPAGPLS